MVVNIIRDKTVVTRKIHCCSACGRAFKASTKMRTQVNIYEGSIGTWRECPTCTELISKFPDHFKDEGVFPHLCVDEILVKGQTPEDLLEKLISDNLYFRED